MKKYLSVKEVANLLVAAEHDNNEFLAIVNIEDKDLAVLWEDAKYQLEDFHQAINDLWDYINEHEDDDGSSTTGD